MANNSQIEWTDATWNPTTGCTKVSPGCANCYIERTPPFRMNGRKFTRGSIPIELHDNRLEAPLHWRKPKRIFVNSLSDLFHEDVPFKFIDRVFAVMALAPRHTFQILTKRPERLAEYMGRDRFATAGRWGAILGTIHFEFDRGDFLGDGLPLPNVWLGTSVEDQKRADERIPHLLRVSSTVRFISAEPLLGPIDLTRFIPAYQSWDHGKPRWNRERWQPPFASAEREEWTSYLDWVIAGGESGPNARPMNPEWARSLRDQCRAARVAFHFKQWGEWLPFGQSGLTQYHPIVPDWTEEIRDAKRRECWADGKRWCFGPNSAEFGAEDVMIRVGKKDAGRELDGREWNDFPEPNPNHIGV